MTAINKVIFGGNTLIDLTDLTVDQDKLLRGYTARRADGNKVTGTMDQTITYVDGHGEMSLDENDYLQYDDSGGASEPNLQSKTNISPTTSSQTITADSGYDGLSSVQINAIPSQYIVPSGSQTVQSNGTYNVTSLAEVIVNVASGGGIPSYSNIKTGSVTFPSRVQTTSNVSITTLSDIGFTPTAFVLYAKQSTLENITNSLVNGTEANGVLILEAFISFATPNYNYYRRASMRISGTTPASSGGQSATSWTTRSNGYLYNDGSVIYVRTASNYGLPANGEYYWIALA